MRLPRQAAALLGQPDCTALGWEAVPAQLRVALRAAAVADPAAVIAGQAALSVFFNGTQGPAVDVAEIDCLTDAAPPVVLPILAALAPNLRWLLNEVAPGSLNANRCALTVRHGYPVLLHADSSVLADLKTGTLRPLADSSPQDCAAGTWELVSRWPGLRAAHVNWDGRELATDVAAAHRAAQAGERGGRIRERVYVSAEEHWVRALKRWHELAVQAPESVPIPRSARPPDGDPWAAEDDMFRTWLVDQALTRHRSSEPDLFLMASIEAQRTDEQKPTHQGWQVARHGITTCLTLDTRRIEPADRRAIRVAALLHDIGKVRNVWTPGAHAKIGAVIWTAVRPPWITDEEATLVSWLIAHHDILGLLDRGVRDPGYRGGLCPRDVRNMLVTLDRPFDDALALAATIYSADIAAVPTLRWLTPLTPILEELVRAGR